jgi:hypothetical protein
MTPEESLNIIEQALNAATLKGQVFTLADIGQILSALNVLHTTIATSSILEKIEE